MFGWKARRLLAPASLLAVFLFCGSARMSASCIDIVTIDENGNGTITGCTTATLTSSGSAPVVYPISFFGVTLGDLILQEPAVTAATTSDVVRFLPPDGVANQIQFYSDSSDGTEALADGTLPSLLTNTVTVTEVGLEGSNGFTYTPTTGQPGFSSSVAVEYVIISDGANVPEPSTMLLAIPAAALIWMRRRKARV